MRFGLVLFVVLFVVSGASAVPEPLRSEGDVREAFGRLYAAWMPFREGMEYEGSASRSELLKPDGGPDRTIRGLTSREAPLQKARNFRFKSEGSDYTLTSIEGDLKGRAWQANGDRLYSIDLDGKAFSSEKRTLRTEADVMRLPFFSPTLAMDTWAAFPWPSNALDPAKLTVTVQRSTDEHSTVAIRRDVVVPNQARRADREIDLHWTEELGWVPVELRVYSGNERFLGRKESYVWQMFTRGDKRIPIPIQCTIESFSRDPATQKDLLGVKSSFTIQPESVKLLREHGDRAAWSAEVILRPFANSLAVSSEQSSTIVQVIRPSLLIMIGAVIIVLTLIKMRWAAGHNVARKKAAS